MWVYDESMAVSDNVNPFYYDRINGTGMGSEPFLMTIYNDTLFFRGYDGAEHRLWTYYFK